jgi:hypothetical protein
MKGILFGMVLVSGLSLAETIQVSVNDFNFTYNDPHGLGTASSFSRSKLKTDQVEVAVERIDKDLRFAVTGVENLEFELKNAPAFMIQAETMSVSNFNMNLAEKLNLSLGAGRFNSPNDNLKLDGFFLDCQRDKSKSEIMDQLLNGCVQKMILKNSKFSSQDAEGFLGAIHSSISVSLSEKADLGVNSLEMKTTNGKFDLIAEVKSSISGKVKSNGNISYDHVTGRLAIKVSEIKFGILNITRKVFDELKKKETDKLKIKEPFIYYSFK